MLKKIIFSGYCTIALMSGAQASDSADLKIITKLEVGSCTPTMSNNGEANFGNIPLGNLSGTTTNQLGSRFLTLTITCTAATTIGWSITDNKKDSVQTLLIKKPKFNSQDLNDVNYEFGLGRTPGGVKIGAYAVYADLNNITGDGNNLTLMYKTDSSATFWTASGTGEIRNDSAYVNACEAGGAMDSIPVAAKTFVFPLKITAAIQDTGTLNISDNTPLDGSSTISLVYL
ncbi:TPA: DUF1120 domain-containing protein [Citrobacter farmeri]|nr:DUF1120 domain-containing protein [Citrobacter farmeri]